LELGGAQSHALRLMKGFYEAGIDVYLILLEKNKETTLSLKDATEKQLISKIITLTNANSRDKTIDKIIRTPYQWIRLEKVLRKLNINIIISFMERSNIINLFTLSQRKRILYLLTYMPLALNRKSFLKRNLIKIFYTFFLKRADKIIFNSKENALIFPTIFPTDQKKIMVIYNPCEINNIQILGNESLPSRFEHFFQQDVIITAGRLVHAKGHWHLLRAFKEVSKFYQNIQLIIVGDGPLRTNLVQLTKELELEKHVFFAGFQKNPMPWIKKAKVFVLSSLWEGFPNAILEAMCLGVPVISVDCSSGPREILSPNTNPLIKTNQLDLAPFGILTPPLDGKNFSASKPLTKSEIILAEAIKTLLKNQKLRFLYSKSGLKKAEEFSFEKIIPKWIGVIKDEEK